MRRLIKCFIINKEIILNVRESYEYDSSDNERNSSGYKKDAELQKEINKQLQLRRKSKSDNKNSDDEKVEGEILAKSSFVKAASSTRCKVKGLTLKVIFLYYIQIRPLIREIYRIKTKILNNNLVNSFEIN